MNSRPIAHPAGLLALFALSALVGCGRETSAPVEPGAQATGPLAVAAATSRSALDALWPNDDGRSWQYDVFWCSSERQSSPIYAMPEQVPPAPEPADVARLLGLGKLVRGAPPDTITPCLGFAGRYGLQFQGNITTLSGVTAQNLVVTLERPGIASEAPTSSRPSSAFLSRLAQARPDLAPRLGAMGYSPEAEFLPAPLFVRGYAWEKTSAYIGTYGDADRNLAWKFLDQNTQRGSSFVFQLVPSLANDVFLHALVVPRNAQDNLRGFSRELQVIYVIDYGILTVVDSTTPTGIGYVRPVDYGTVVYVPKVGPVSDFERLGGTSGAPQKTSMSLQLTLSGTSPGPAAVALR